MKWLLVAAVVLVAVFAIVGVMGMLLPRTHVASRTLRVKRAPADVWPIVTQTMNASDVPVDILESVPPYRLVSKVKDTETMFGGTWTVAIAAVPDGSTVTITEDGWVGNPIFRFVSRFVIGHHATMDGMLKQVAKTFNEDAALSGE